MKSQTDESKIIEQISNAIKSGRVKMRPKWYFVLNAALYWCGLVIIVLLLLYLFSFVIFILRQTGIWFAPTFGWQGWYFLLIYSPWLLLAIILFFMVVLEILASHYAFVYRYPLLYSALGIIVLVLIGGYITAATPLHGFLYDNARADRLPLAGRFYRDYGRQKFDEIHRGEIIRVNSDGFTIEDTREESLTILVSTSTRLVSGDDFLPGQTVVVFGQEQEIDHTIRAQAINKLTR